MKKRMIALLLCAALLCALLTQMVSAAETTEIAETDEEIRVKCSEVLEAVINKTTGVMTFEVTGEINLSVDAMGQTTFAPFSDYIKQVIFPLQLRSIEHDSFAGCTRLERIELSVNISYIGENAFKGCTSLERVELPASISSIGYSAFEGCTSLKEGFIPAGLRRLEPYAFTRCSSLTRFVVDPENEYFEADAEGVLYNAQMKKLVQCPGGKTGTYTVYERTEELEAGAFAGCRLSNVNLPEKLRIIGYQAFADCPNLTELTIPKNVFSCAGPIAYGSENLRRFVVDPENTDFSADSYGGLYYGTGFKECPSGFRGKYIVREGTSSIFTGAFSQHTGLTEVWMPDSVTIIEGAFDGCTSLTKVRFSNNLETIGFEAFMGCTALQELVIPEKVSMISLCAFSFCNSLKSVYFMGDAPEMGAGFVNYVPHGDGTSWAIPGMTLYYIEGKAGWDAQEQYPTAVWTTAPYSDAKPGSWYESAVRYATDHNLMNGTGTHSFEPESSMTRAMLVTVLWRYAGEPRRGSNRFSDVPSGEWYTQAVAWAAADGVVNGVGNRRFDPNGSVSREQMATILFRYAKKTGVNTESRADLSAFPDAGAVDRYASDAMQWAVGEGIIGGSREADGADWLKPLGDATRAQVAAILMRFIQNLEK